MSKVLPILALALVMVGCEAVNNQKPSKPFGISKYNNDAPKGDHFMKGMLAQPEAKPTAPPAANASAVAAPACAPTVVTPVSTPSASTPSASTPSTSSTTDDANAQALRQRYGIPDTSVIKNEDVNAMIRFYTMECLRLQERQR